MVRIENLTNRLVSLRLNNGKTLHLPPRMVFTEVSDAQIANNAKVAKLRDRRIIALADTKAKGAEDAGRGRAARARSGKSSASAGSSKEGE